MIFNDSIRQSSTYYCTYSSLLSNIILFNKIMNNTSHPISPLPSFVRIHEYTRRLRTFLYLETARRSKGLIKECSPGPRKIGQQPSCTSIRGLGGRGPKRTTAVNRGQKGIGASETERNRVFVALLPGSRLGPPLSAHVCPAQTLFLQIEPHVPPFTLYPFSFSSSFSLPPPPYSTLSFSQSLSLSFSLFFSLFFLPFFPSFFLTFSSPRSFQAFPVARSLSFSLPSPSSPPLFRSPCLAGTHTPLRTHATGGKV